MAVIGFQNGIVRFTQITFNNIRLIKAMKVHEDAISHLLFTPSQSVLAVASVTGDLFFLGYNEKTFEVEPFCFFKTNMKINSMHFSSHEHKLLLGC